MISAFPRNHSLRSRRALVAVRGLALVITGAFLLFTVPELVSQSYTWRNVEINGGGFVTGIVFHPTEPGLVYARTDVGGIYRLDSTTSRWIALNDDIGGLNNEFQHLGVLSIGLDPNDANRVVIATGQYAGAETWKLPSRIYRSSDRGATWAYVTPGFKMSGNGEGRGTGERIAVDPVNGANILVGSSDTGIWRSTDSGATWTRMSSFTPTSCNFVIYAPANHVSPGPNRRVYAAANTLTGQSFWFSDDNGTTWAEVPNHPGAVAGHEMMPLQGSFDAAGVFYMTWADATGPANWATDFGVWKLSANGTTWTKLVPPGGQGFFAGIAADPRVAGHVLVTTLLRWWPGDEVYRSTDGGATWTAALRTGTRSAGNSPWASSVGPHWMTDIEIDPFDSNRAMFNTGFGLFQTTNLSATGTARTWTFFNDGLEELVPLGLLSPTAGPPLISVTGDYTGFRHDDLNRSPTRGRHSPENGSNSIVVGADLAPSVMIRQNGDDTYFSRDAAVTWAKFPGQPPTVINGAGRAVPSADGSRIVWCPPNAPAYFSTDNGTTWTASAGSASVNSSGNLTAGTLAGGMGIAGLVNSSGGNARFSGPEGIAIGPTGVRYVADTGNHAIRVIAAGEAVSTLGGNGTAGSTDGNATVSRFNAPSDIAISGGNLFIADSGSHTIRRLTLSGNATTFAGSAGVAGSAEGNGTAASFNTPRGIAADSAGTLYVADAGNHAIRKISPAGAVTVFAGTAGTAGSADGTGTAAQFNTPSGIAVDDSGNVFVADTGNHVIRKITPAGAVTTFAGTAGSSGSANGTGTAARFNAPSGIAADGTGTLYVADSGNNAVRRITSAGIVSTVAGGTAGAANGTGAGATFQDPSGIAVDAEGLNVYVADSGNHVIRRGTLLNSLMPFSDRVDAQRMYLWDATARKLLTTTNGATSFSVAASGMNAAFAQFRTVPGHNGHIWVRAGSSGLYRSTDFGATFTKLSSVAEVYQFDFGMAKPGSTHPAVFIWGKVGTAVGFFRSDDTGATWVRINDSLHNFGYQNDMAGDPRVFGRVYLATSGRGVIVGETTEAVVSIANLAQTYDGAPKPVTVTTVPSGLGTTVTYNGSLIVPTGAGTYSISATVNDPVMSGSANATLVISKAVASVELGNIFALADGTPKSAAATTAPPGLPVTMTYNGSAIAPSLAGSYAIVATVTDLNYLGSANATLVIHQPALAAMDVTGWESNIAGKVTGNTTSSPVLNPNDTTDTYTTNTLQANFSPITLANAGDKITITGSLQMTPAAVANQGNWFRFGFYDNRNQASNTATGWLGLTAMASATTSLYERISSTGLFSSGTGAALRTLDSSPAPVGSNSPSDNPPLAFEATITRTSAGVVLCHTIRRTDTNAVLMNQTFTDTTPNNNGLLTGNATAAIGYTPTYNTAGFAFARSYIGTTGSQARFSNIQVSFSPGSPSPAEAWRQTHFGTAASSGNASDSADPDRDGEANFLEFCTGQNPLAGTTAGVAADAPAGGIEFTYHRSRAAVDSGYLFSVEWSDSLAADTWTPVGPGSIVTDGSVQAMQAVIPAGSGNRRFIRLHVTGP